MSGEDTVRVMFSGSSRWGTTFGVLAALGFVLFGLATGVLMAPWAPLLGDRLGELTCLQVAFTPARAAAVLAAITPSEREAFRNLLAPGDLALALGYGLLLTGLLGLVVRRLPAGWQPLGSLLMWAPLAAAACDWVEDAFLYQLAALPAVPETSLLPLAAGIAATVKYLLLSVVTPVFALVGSSKAAGVDRGAGSVALYVLVVLLSLSMLFRPLQQLPACF
jgi:hypothetical protein